MLRGSTYDISQSSLRIKCGLLYLIGEWMFSFDYTTPHKSLDIRQLWLLQHCSTYTWKANWTHRALGIEVLFHNPFSSFEKQHITMDYGCYNRNSWSFDETRGCNISLTLTYSFNFGNKPERGEIDVNKKFDSAIMKFY